MTHASSFSLRTKNKQEFQVEEYLYKISKAMWVYMCGMYYGGFAMNNAVRNYEF